MSFILDALNKKQSEQNTQNEHLSLNSSLNSAFNTSANASLQMQDFDRPTPIRVVTEFRPQSIAWGVLLTLAIFLALAMGFWLGSHSQPLNTQTAAQLPVPVAIVSATSQAINQTAPAIQAIEFINGSSNNTTVNTSANAEVAKIPAEDYFENPPVKALGDVNSESEIVEHIINVQTASEKLNDIKFNVKATDGVSSDLLSLFQSAIDETNTTNETSSENESSGRNNGNDNRAINASTPTRHLIEMPLWVQNGVPKMDFSMHIYASDGTGWVRVNGEDKVENDYISADVLLVEILPQKVILAYRGEHFSLQALSSW